MRSANPERILPPNVSELSGIVSEARDVRLNDWFAGIESGDFLDASIPACGANCVGIPLVAPKRNLPCRHQRLRYARTLIALRNLAVFPGCIYPAFLCYD